MLLKFPVSLLIGLFMTVAAADAATVSLRSNVGVGYRQDNLSWSIAGTMSGNDPNILSELEWDVEALLLTGDFWLSPAKESSSAPFLRLWGGYGSIFEGDARDSDYQGDNRSDEYSRMECAADDGYVYDLAAAIGWEFDWQTGAGRHFSVAPFVGYGYSVQDLSLTDGRQTVSSRYSLPLGPIFGLDSSYSSEWQGSLVGMRLRYEQPDTMSVWLEGRYHQVDYEGEGEWNLRTDFAQDPSFRQTAEGTGWTFSGGGDYQMTQRSSLGAEFSYRKWTADEDGVDTVYFANGSQARTRFNEAEWEAWSVSLSLICTF